MIEIIIFLLILVIIILLYFLNKKKIKKLFYKKEVEEVDISSLHSIFQTNKIDTNLYGPKKETIIKSFSISPENKIVGMTSDYEAWIISSLSKISKNIFEFGTCSGKTTYLMGLNSPNDAQIYSITLNPNQKNNINKDMKDNKISYRNIKSESVYEKFLFSGTEIENKINVIFQNSIELDEKKFDNFFDLIFIDGGHTYSIVKNDSEKSLKMLSPKGIILWHDYVPGKESSKDVVKYINEISKNYKIFHIKNTSICFYKN